MSKKSSTRITVDESKEERSALIHDNQRKSSNLSLLQTESGDAPLALASEDLVVEVDIGHKHTRLPSRKVSTSREPVKFRDRIRTWTMCSFRDSVFLGESLELTVGSMWFVDEGAEITMFLKVIT